MQGARNCFAFYLTNEMILKFSFEMFNKQKIEITQLNSTH